MLDFYQILWVPICRGEKIRGTSGRACDLEDVAADLTGLIGASFWVRIFTGVDEAKVFGVLEETSGRHSFDSLESQIQNDFLMEVRPRVLHAWLIDLFFRPKDLRQLGTDSEQYPLAPTSTAKR